MNQMFPQRVIERAKTTVKDPRVTNKLSIIKEMKGKVTFIKNVNIPTSNNITEIS